jgi:hypothetical protein
VTIGLGPAGKADSFEIIWPSGHTQKVSPPPVNRFTTFTEAR